MSRKEEAVWIATCSRSPFSAARPGTGPHLLELLCTTRPSSNQIACSLSITKEQMHRYAHHSKIEDSITTIHLFAVI